MGEGASPFSIAVMARTVADVLAGLSAHAPLSKAAGWDPVGLQLGALDAPAGRVGVAHEVTDDVLARVEADGVELLVAYHPLLFRATNRLTAGRTPEGRAYRLVRAGVALAVVHTAFDVAPGGAADRLAEALDLEGCRGFGPLWPADSVKVVVFAPEEDAETLIAAMSASGAGEIGGYTSCSFRAPGTATFYPPETARPAVGVAGRMNREPEVRIEMIAPKDRADAVVAAVVAAHRYEEPAYDVVEVSASAGFVGRVGSLAPPATLEDVAARVGSRLCTPVRFAGDPHRTVETMAVVPGSGAPFLGAAAGMADLMVTGDVSHHRAREAIDRGLAIIDAGHVPTERPGVGALYALVSELVPDAADLTTIDPHPWKER